ncbi:MAG: P1 family peptidase [Gaiellaceae bacterium]
MTAQLPEGVLIGHWTDREAWTGCTVVLLPEGSVASCEVRGGAPGTRETDGLSLAAADAGSNAILLTGGSSFGLGAADGVVRWLAERGRGHAMPAGPVPVVAAAVVYDLRLGSSTVWPTADGGYAACEAATPTPEHGSVGAGTGCTVGKLLRDGWTKGGFGMASLALDGGCVVAAVAVVNAVGEVLDGDGTVLAGIWRDDSYVSSSEVLREQGLRGRSGREATTLVCVLTDARLTKTEAWLCARSAGAGMARAVTPVWTQFDGDAVFCAATNTVDADPAVVSALAADVTADAIRDAVREATGAPGCPAASER